MSEIKIIGCEEALRLLAAHLDGELDGVEHVEVQRHLEQCRSCYSRSEFERRLKGQLADLRAQPMPVAFEARIRALMDRFVVLSDRATDRLK
jgi:predicted anti-sigma-YlaC factor YlaD